jgi:cellulose synthase (UDP-forming)
MKLKKQSDLNPPILAFVTLVSVIYFSYYLWWRVTTTFNPAYPLFSWLLWLAEAFGVVSYFLFAYFTRNVAPIVPYALPQKNLKVDIFIPTYNEDNEILEATLIGCNLIRYPHKTYILDDGNRSSVRQLATRLGCGYIAHPTHDNAKAGNINFALAQTDGEFIAILDADMIPQPGYLDRTLGYFKDELLALVQLPQEFYNRDSIQHLSNKKPWHEQTLFFRVIQPGKNYSNSAFWCGSPSVIRRKSLMDVGGVSTETITEDIHTTVRLHSRGWKTLFINEPLAFGIAPQTITAFLLQRLRWAQGTMQLYRSKESPLWIAGLTLKQRFSYLASFMAYLEAFQKFILISMPILILGFNIFPMKVGFDNFIIHWIPFFLLTIIANQIGGRGVFNYFNTEKYNLLKTMIFIRSTITLISRQPIKFKVTPKTVEESVYNEERNSLRWYMVIFGTLVGSMLFATIRIFAQRSDPISPEAFSIALFWALYNSLVIFLAIKEVFQKRHDRKQYRFPVNLDGVLLSTQPGIIAKKISIVDLSTHGCGFLLDGKIPETFSDLRIKFFTVGLKEISVPIDRIVFQSNQPFKKNLVGSLFSELTDQQRNLLFEYLFVYIPSMRDNSSYQIFKWDPVKQLRNLIRTTQV